MSIGTVATCGCVPCAISVRCVSATMSPGGVDTANMVDWVNAYDITTVGWGAAVAASFSTPGQASPDSIGGFGCGTTACIPTNYTLSVIGQNPDRSCIVGFYTGPQTVQRSQFLLPFPMAYFVIANGMTLDAGYCGGGGDNFSMGCTYPSQADTTFVDIPIPDQTLDTGILVQEYFFGVITTAYGIHVDQVNIGTAPDLTSMTPSNCGVADFGAKWAASIGTSCIESPGDPFAGSDPP